MSDQFTRLKYSIPPYVSFVCIFLALFVFLTSLFFWWKSSPLDYTIVTDEDLSVYNDNLKLEAVIDAERAAASQDLEVVQIRDLFADYRYDEESYSWEVFFAARDNVQLSGMLDLWMQFIGISFEHHDTLRHIQSKLYFEDSNVYLKEHVISSLADGYVAVNKDKIEVHFHPSGYFYYLPNENLSEERVVFLPLIGNSGELYLYRMVDITNVQGVFRHLEGYSELRPDEVNKI